MFFAHGEFFFLYSFLLPWATPRQAGYLGGLVTKQNNGSKRQAVGIGGLVRRPVSAGQRPHRHLCLFVDSCRAKKMKKTAHDDFKFR